VVDEQLPAEPWAVDLGRLGLDVPAQHDEADRLYVGVDGSAPGVSVRVLGGFLERVGHRGDEPFLAGCGMQHEDGRSVVVGDLHEIDRHDEQRTGERAAVAGLP